MTFADLLRILEVRAVLPRAAQMGTALRTLAAALGYERLDECPLGDACARKPRGRTAGGPLPGAGGAKREREYQAQYAQ